jgi:hypothetical protein
MLDFFCVPLLWFCKTKQQRCRRRPQQKESVRAEHGGRIPFSDPSQYLTVIFLEAFLKSLFLEVFLNSLF